MIVPYVLQPFELARGTEPPLVDLDRQPFWSTLSNCFLPGKQFPVLGHSLAKSHTDPRTLSSFPPLCSSNGGSHRIL